ncbi:MULTISPECIES: LLM class flavin-dependent oxidoreductase [Kitasatospora]|uniref:Putative oxidoreductase n=1 Tax=Kitasatospora setae (strain ATCC 33774 / DSM 43861 / JCM 3304 / KCC A-0304 / NBRC 14216 / KM-6054) TaxID=452652 RepID=E4N4G3_KITSK|nr:MULTISPECIES: LLM class flavin-dependent oxidoreductase [Kitasatospora]BAJ26094.1 putative oxidoreductase [Kitasatospora setae KM-6054]
MTQTAQTVQSVQPAQPSVPSGRVGVLLPRDLPVRQLLPYARRAEELGFDELWVVEDLGWRGGVAQAASVLAATRRITVGIGILPAGARNVCFAAMELATLAQLHPGRLTAGIGHGMRAWMEEAGGGWPASPLTLLREYATALRALLRGEPAPADGRYVRCAGVRLTETPETAPPVLLGVRGPKSQALAGESADGLLLAEPAPPAYVAASLRRLGRAGAEVVTYDVAAVDEDGDAAVERVRAGLAAIGEPDWAPHLAPLPFAAEFRAHRAASADGAESARTMPAAWVRELAVAGTPAQARAAIAARWAAGATSVVLTPVGADPLGALESLARALPGGDE